MDKKILIVDDEKNIVFMIREILSGLDCQILIETSPKAAVQLLKKEGESFSVLITDILMEEIDGIELAKICKVMNPDIKVIAISGSQTAANLIDKMSSDEKQIIYKFFFKPFDNKELLETVKQLLTS